MYLTETEMQGLRRMAAATGKSQAELSRPGPQLVIEQQAAPLPALRRAPDEGARPLLMALLVDAGGTSVD